jgi:hypothetical protein
MEIYLKFMEICESYINLWKGHRHGLEIVVIFTSNPSKYLDFAI